MKHCVTTLSGVRLPSYINEEDLDSLRDEFEFKDGDIILIAYPKCGTHWVKGFLPMLINDETKFDVVRWVGCMRNDLNSQNQ